MGNGTTPEKPVPSTMRPINLPAYGSIRGMPTLSEDLAFRGLIHQVTDPDLPKRLDDKTAPITLYAGFDPSADSLHVGNLLQLCTLRRFQEAGHRPISLAGGGTGMIGDPGGKQDERQLLTLETIESYLESVRPQLGQFLDLDRALLLNNADWLATLSTLEFLRDVGKHFTVNQMVGKESVKSRFERPDQGISYTEFSYMLLQAYDFLRLHEDYGCDLQIGGSDQWGNITMGVELIRKVCGDEAYGLTTPLVAQARRHQVRQDRERHGLARCAAHQPLRHVPVLRQHARRTGRPAVAVLDLFGSRRNLPTGLGHGDAPGAPPGPKGPRPRRRGDGARGGRGLQVRRGLGRPLHRGDRRPERGHAARRDGGRADDGVEPVRAARWWPRAGRRVRAHRPGQVAPRRPTAPSRVVGSTSTT